jgi:alanine racemase
MKTWLEISRSALAYNLRAIRRLAPESEIIPTIKANAYGHGWLNVARTLDKIGVQWFGIDSLEEAEALRQADFKQKILILGYVPLADLARAYRLNLSLTIYNIETIRALSHLASHSRPAKIHLKIETGLVRQGVRLNELPRFLSELKRWRNIVLEGMSTHFANIEDTRSDSFAKLQLERFKRAFALLERAGFHPLRHCACSAAAILYPQTRLDLIRFGISLYGLWSSELTELGARLKKIPIKLKPVLSWKTKVAQIKKVPRGTPIGYGLTEVVKRPTIVAILPVGYADGYNRSLSNKGEVLICGKRCKVLGRICMNICMVDATAVKGIRLEDEVVLIGQQKKQKISADELAVKADTINYDLVARLNPLIARCLVK